VVVRLGGRLAATHPYRLALAPQASAEDDLYTVEVTGRNGWKAGTVGPPPAGKRTDLVVPMFGR